MTAKQRRPAPPPSRSRGGATSRKAARDRAAAQRALAAARGERRRRMLLVAGSVVAVLAVVGVFVGVKLASGPSSPASGGRSTSASQAVTAKVTSVPARVLNTVGTGTAAVPPKALTGAPLTAGGKPEILYVGAEWCPYCAAERWSLAVALSRFGTLTDLGETFSSPTDVYAHTATLSFHGANYSSDYLSLTAKEIYSNQRSGNSYAPLDKLTPAENSLFQSVGKGSFPFIDLGGKYVISGASYDPSVLQGKTQAQIAAALSDPSSPIAKAVDGTANVITAAICRLTGGKPGNVCTSGGVTAAAKSLPPAGG